MTQAIEPPLTPGSTIQWTAPKFGGCPIPGKKSDALKTKHLLERLHPRQLEIKYAGCST